MVDRFIFCRLIISKESKLFLSGRIGQNRARGSPYAVASTWWDLGRIIFNNIMQVIPGEWLHISVRFQNLFYLILIKH
ncbi:hypothetical protein V1478_018464 [Vespula squamosa]|uniref:Uncharacterized protein n=1 Tax=Vespula squamosa TaxID=30214 RepID=A0ABD1ZV33_VESSQ